MKENQKIFYLRIILIFLVLALVGGLFLDISFGNPQKSKWHYIFQKYYLKKIINIPKSFSGEWKEWNEKGELYVSTQLKDGIMHGEQLVWNSNPSYVYKRQLYKYGKLHGKQEYLHPNGDISSLSIWDNGQQNGHQIQYYGNNKIKYKEEYKNNIKDGAFIGYYVDGTKKMVGNFKNNKPMGEWYFWDIDGKLNSKLNGDNDPEMLAISQLLSGFFNQY